MNKLLTIYTLCLIITLSALADPTEMRNWHSKNGDTIEAMAVQTKGNKVQLKNPQGKTMVVTFDIFSDEDRIYLIKHFGLEKTMPLPGEPLFSPVPKINGGLPHAIGEVLGPIDAGDGSHYFLYIPSTLREDRKAPLLLYTGAGGGKAGSVWRHIEGA